MGDEVPAAETADSGKEIGSLKDSLKDRRFRYSDECVEHVLRLRVSTGRLWTELSKEFNVPMQTLMQWVQREKLRGTELGKELCSNALEIRRRKLSRMPGPLKEEKDIVKFPGGSEYRRGENGSAVLVSATEKVPAIQTPALAAEPDQSLVDEIFEELAMKMGRQLIEITSLKARLRRSVGSTK